MILKYRRRSVVWCVGILLLFVAAELSSAVPAAAAPAHYNPSLLYTQQLAEFWALKRFFVDQDKPVVLQNKLTEKLLAKADQDECFAGIGEPYPDKVRGRCPKRSVPKANQAYVWGMTHTGGDIWFGTMANTLCYAMETLALYAEPMQNRSWVCEFNEAASGTGDWRSPKIYRYNPTTKVLTERVLDPTTEAAALALLNDTAGLRSAGSLGGVVFVGGPSRDSMHVNLFAFDAVTGALLGIKQFDEYNDIREWTTAGPGLGVGLLGNDVDKALYVGMGNIVYDLWPTGIGGTVLKWVGSAADPFQFEIVGKLPSEVANLTEHEGRLCVSTWPSYNYNPLYPDDIRFTGVFCSRPIPTGGLTSDEPSVNFCGDPATCWFQIWGYEAYDPEFVLWLITGGGAIRSFNGSLFWGTMNVPFLGAITALQIYTEAGLDANGNSELDLAEMMNVALGTHRSASLFRATGVGTLEQKVDLIYGETYMPTYDGASRSFRIAYDGAHQNLMGQVPLQGASGLGNFFNAYVWSSRVFNNAIYFGTFDWTQVARAGLEMLPSMIGPLNSGATWKQLARSGSVEATGAVGQFVPQFGLLMQHSFWDSMLNQIPVEGADLLRIEDVATAKAVAESKCGLVNNVNYGVRTLVTDPLGTTLFAGMANAMNLDPKGGWELIGATPTPCRRR